MKKQLKRILMLVASYSLIGFLFAQAVENDNSDDFFEFVVINDSEHATEQVHSLSGTTDAETERKDNVQAEEGSEPVVTESESDTSPVESPSTDPVVPETVSDANPEEAPSTDPVIPESESDANPEETPSTDPVVTESDSVVPQGDSSNSETVETLSSSSEENNKVPESETLVQTENVSDQKDNTRDTSQSSITDRSENSLSQPILESSSESVELNEESLEEEKEELPVDDKAPSRSVTMKKKEYLDITYPGEGWLYMGDENNSKTLSFKGREQKGNETKLKFLSERAGEALLHFCKQDILTDTYIHDYLLVIIENKNGSRKHVQAPEYVPIVIQTDEEAEYEEESLEEAEDDVSELETGNVEDEGNLVQEESELDDIVIESGIILSDEPDVVFSFGDGIDFFGADSSDDDYYQQLIDEANDAFFSGNGQEAIDKAQIVIDEGSYLSDEAYYIQAQVYETNSELLDVNKAYDLYKTIVDYYPESSFWNKASKRVTYLDRYYYSIR